jgi:hypothetical protein
MLFGRAFEQAVAALSRREDPAVLFEQWGVYKDMGLILLRQRQLGPHAATRHPVARALRSGRALSHSAPSLNPADSVHADLGFRQRPIRSCRRSLDFVLAFPGHDIRSESVLSKLKCPLFVASEMSGFVNLPQPPRRWESGNPAHFAGFPSAVGKSAFGLFHGASFPRPCLPPVSS